MGQKHGTRASESMCDRLASTVGPGIGAPDRLRGREEVWGGGGSGRQKRDQGQTKWEQGDKICGKRGALKVVYRNEECKVFIKIFESM